MQLLQKALLCEWHLNQLLPRAIVQKATVAKSIALRMALGNLFLQ